MNNNYVVEVKNLNKRFGKKEVLKDVSFYVKKNEIVGFIGPNGAGKSTTMKCLCNLIYPDSGEIIIDGYDLFKDRKKALAVQSSLIENPGLYTDMTGRENLKMIAELRGIDNTRLNEIFDFVEIGEALDRKVSGYSMGMKQRLGLGIAIMSKPKFLILDEPTNGLDPTGIIRFRSTIQELMRREDISILFSSHQLGEIEKLADRIICINNGEIIETPKTFENYYSFIFQFEKVHEAYELLSLLMDEDKFKLVGSDSISIDLSGPEMLNKIMHHFIEKSIYILDITKNSIDIETIYKEVYNA